ncbi:MAG: tetratricopeptide repeat protein [Rickettsiales bacterium]|nr:tetratricopeptide repeat protein [Rickettsiales bacterium]MCA0253951.1 tetratricopeptide repeat protein [Pseudomonadota bacterium]
MKYNEKLIIYKQYLSDINNISFTQREIDVIACIIHNRGEKKIAILLKISPRTVSAHVHNIMLKIGTNSREGIIDFIEQTAKSTTIREYYLHLLVRNCIDKCLNHIASTLNKNGSYYHLYHQDLESQEKEKLQQIAADLKIANIELSTNNEEISIPTLIVLNENLDIDFEQKEYIFLLLNNKIDIHKNNQNYLDFSENVNYYDSLFDLLKQLISNPKLGEVISSAKKEFSSINMSWNLSANQNEQSSSKLENSVSKSYILLFIIISVLLSIGTLIFKNYSKLFKINISNSIINNDLLVPQDYKLLERTNIEQKLEQKLSKNTGIQSVALVGIGGSGKTTIARQYARNSDASLIWEINAENKETIISSMQQLAQEAAKNSKDQDELEQIKTIRDVSEKERRLWLFLSKSIRKYNGWLLIYDNVRNFQEVIKYFPHDENIWGNGKVIITTSNANITHSDYISDKNVIYVNDLSNPEKLRLFAKIISGNDQLSETQKKDYESCLKNIPSFPLDISIAAHYIKETKISCEKYLQYTQTPNPSFIFAQKNILQDVGEYTKTRYDIITLSLDHLIKISPDFKDLLFIISISNSQNIPKELLSLFKDEVIVDSFLRELKKFSLITQETNEHSASTFSIHRNTQSAIRTYFAPLLKHSNDQQYLYNISTTIEDYIHNQIKNDNLGKIQLLTLHVESIISQDNLFSELDRENLRYNLGICYFHLSNYAKAKVLLEQSLTTYEKYYGENHIRTAKTIARLASVHRNMGNYEKSKDMFEKAIVIYKKYYGDWHTETAWIYVYLGSVYRHYGDYSKSIKLLQNGFDIYKDHYTKEHIETAKASAYLAIVYKDLGNYQEARTLLEEALKYYTAFYGNKHTKTAWLSVNLACVYRNLGNGDQAIKLLEIAAKIYEQNTPKNCLENAWTLGHIGATYIDLDKLEKADYTLNKSLEIYTKLVDGDNMAIGWIYYHLGRLYIKKDQLDKARNMLNKSLDIHKKNYGANNLKTQKVINTISSIKLQHDNSG